jgi:hypothetical protein
VAGAAAFVERLQLVCAVVLRVYRSALTRNHRVFLWASLFYSCCMTGNKQGPIALAGYQAQIGLDAETEDDEAVARNLQAQDRNWQA